MSTWQCSTVFLLCYCCVTLMQDMFGTLQQGTSPVRNRSEATASGDRWIAEVWSKGKAVNVPQLPGQRNFADLLQQTYSNPYKSAAAEDRVGDAWLSCRGKAAVPSSGGKPPHSSKQPLQQLLQRPALVCFCIVFSCIAGVTAVPFAASSYNSAAFVHACHVACMRRLTAGSA